MLVTINEKVYELKKLERNQKISKDFDLLAVQKEKSEHKKYIPPMTHPWRLSSFELQIKLAHNGKNMLKIKLAEILFKIFSANVKKISGHFQKLLTYFLF